MGAFDDLIPGSSQGGGGAFDDLIPNAGPRFDAIEAPNWFERQLAKVSIPQPVEYGLNRARGFAMGAADPSVGAFQLAANMLPGETGDRVNQAIAAKEREYEAQRAGVGSEGFDWMRMGGNVVSPVNLMLARAVPLSGADKLRTLAAKGSGIGAAGGVLQPVTDTETPYWETKAQQAGMGTVAGAVLTPALAKFGNALVRRIGTPDAEVAGARASVHADKAIKDALADVGQTIDDIPADQLSSLRQQVVEAMKSGKKLDAAAALRKADFDSVGIKPTLGQVTRDATQFARERNLRGVENVGEPLMQRFAAQDKALTSGLGKYAQGADDSFAAGEKLVASLKSTDKSLADRVNALYAQARQSAGKDLDVPLQGLAQDYADVVNRFGDKVPSGVMNQFRALGLDPAMPSNQKQVFTIENANKLLKVINDNVGSDKPTNTALSELRNAVKNSVLSADPKGGPFAPAVKAAASRFKLHDAVPALKAAANGDIAPDDFVRRFIINGKANDVQGMAKVLKTMDAESFKQARSQIGAHLQRAAFGENIAGDKAFSQERFNKVLRELGQAKLSAFFSPEELFHITRLGRVGAYIHSQPTASPVNSSNTAGAMMNLLQRLPGVSPAVSLANSARNSVNNASAVRSGLRGEVPITATDLTPEQVNRLSALLGFGAVSGGTLAGATAR